MPWNGIRRSAPERVPPPVVVPAGAPVPVVCSVATRRGGWPRWRYLPDVVEPLCGADVAAPLGPEPLVELVPDWADPVEPVLPDRVVPLVSALPDLALEPESDVVVTAPDVPPLPEFPEVATGSEVALPVSVDPVDPVRPDVAAALPQLPVTVTQGATTTAGPELPEFPELPELPDCAVPVDVADPVFPESALPEWASVELPLDDWAAPLVPPVVVPWAVESPLWPEVAPAVEPESAAPVFPEVAVPVALPDGSPDPVHEPAPADPVVGSDVAGPLAPEPFCEDVPASADPVDPVLPDRVVPRVSALPDVAVEPESDVVLTGPDVPPLPESPVTAIGAEVAEPVPVEPVEPVAPDRAFRVPWPQEPWPHEPRPQPWRQFMTGVQCRPDGAGAYTRVPPEFPDEPEFPELPEVAVPMAVAGPVLPESALPDPASVWLLLTDVAEPVVPPVVVPDAELFPLPPDVAPAVDLSVAPPVRPEWADPLASPDVTVWVGWGGFPPPQADPAPAVPAARRRDPPTSPDARSVCLIRVLMVMRPFEWSPPSGGQGALRCPSGREVIQG